MSTVHFYSKDTGENTKRITNLLTLWRGLKTQFCYLDFHAENNVFQLI